MAPTTTDVITYSFIIPVYNRPDEIRELLESLLEQTRRDFEVVVVEDGSTLPCRDVVDRFGERLNLQYVAKENTGQGFSRNVGFEHARGAIWILMDSDCLVPPGYLDAVEQGMSRQGLDAFGGPDRAHASFTPMQKAINCAMTSYWTTGGIRNRADGLETYHPRSFNMGFRREVVARVGGFRITRLGEDIEFSERILAAGFKVGLIEEAFVYHKRRTTMGAFARQLHFFGRARVNMWRFHPSQLKAVHLFPALFLLGLVATGLCGLSAALMWGTVTAGWMGVGDAPGWAGPAGLLAVAGLALYGAYALLVLVDAWRMERSTKVALLAVAAVFVQLTSYGVGFLQEMGGHWLGGRST